MAIQKRRSGDTEIGSIAISIFNKVRDIKKTNPDVSGKIDKLEKEIRERLVQIKGEINKLDRHDRDLVKILVINGLHRTADEVLID